MSKIKDISFFKNDDLSVMINLDSGNCCKYSIGSKKYLKYIDKIRKGLIGIEVFDQVSIDDKLINLNIDRSFCMGISSSILKAASEEEGGHLFEYISDVYSVPHIVVDLDGILVLVNDYHFLKPFLDFINNCSDNISDIKQILSKYDLDIFSNRYEFIDVDNFFTITEVLDTIDDYCDSSIMISGNDIIYDLAFSLGIDYIKIDKYSSVDRFLEIVNIMNF